MALTVCFTSLHIYAAMCEEVLAATLGYGIDFGKNL